MTDINFHNRRIISKLAGDDGEFQLKMEVDAIKWLSGVTSSHLQCASSGAFNDHPDVFLLIFLSH